MVVPPNKTIMGTHDAKYFIGNIKFDPIVMKDRSGKTISNEFRAYANKNWWDARSKGCPHIGVDISQWWPFYSIELKTTRS